MNYGLVTIRVAPTDFFLALLLLFMWKSKFMSITLLYSNGSLFIAKNCVKSEDINKFIRILRFFLLFDLSF